MARRVSWTNNSSGHLGTYVYRAPTLDPQNLPAPVATVDPVAQGAAAEWVDNEALAAGDYDYAVQDYDGEGVSLLSAVVIQNVPQSLSSAQVGDEIGGGVYAGTITYADSRQFHIIFALQSGELAPSDPDTLWKTEATDTPGTYSSDDGYANTQAMIADGISLHPAGSHAVNYTDAEGNADYYLPALNEVRMENSLIGHPEFSTNAAGYRWSSTSVNSGQAYTKQFSVDFDKTSGKNDWNNYVRPVRRVPV